MKVAWITGASRGIGEAIARRLVQEGYAVALSARDAASLEAIATSLPEALALAGDLTREEDVARILRQIEERWGRLDALINNAGVARLGRLSEMQAEAWDEVLAANLRAPFLCTRAALPLLRASRGHVVNVGSVAARRVFPAWGAYCASKAGLEAFSRVLAEEERAFGVRVALIHAGATDSPIWERAGLHDMPRERMMACEDVAAAIAFALSQPLRARLAELVLEPSAGDL